MRATLPPISPHRAIGCANPTSAQVASFAPTRVSGFEKQIHAWHRAGDVSAGSSRDDIRAAAGIRGIIQQGAPYIRRLLIKNEEWDHEFLDLLERDPESLASLRTQDYIERGGAEGAEVVMWLAMRGALSNDIRKLHVNYHGPLHTGFAQILFEEIGA
jgi:hypothetical protein